MTKTLPSSHGEDFLLDTATALAAVVVPSNKPYQVGTVLMVIVLNFLWGSCLSHGASPSNETYMNIDATISSFIGALMLLAAKQPFVHSHGTARINYNQVEKMLQEKKSPDPTIEGEHLSFHPEEPVQAEQCLQQGTCDARLLSLHNHPLVKSSLVICNSALKITIGSREGTVTKTCRWTPQSAEGPPCIQFGLFIQHNH